MIDLYKVLEKKMIETMANSHTILIAKITKVNDKTINAKPVINRVIDNKSIELPEFIEIPPIFLQGGTSYTAHPIAVGDYCLLLVNERCFDLWYQGSDFVSPADTRIMDYSDSFALVGVNPLQKAITIPKVITEIGDKYKKGDHEHEGNLDQTGDITLDGDIAQTGDTKIYGDLTVTGNITVEGNITCTGNLTVSGAIIGTGGLAVSGGSGAIASGDLTVDGGDITVDGISLKNHTHSYTWTAGAGAGNTGVAQ